MLWLLPIIAPGQHQQGSVVGRNFINATVRNDVDRKSTRLNSSHLVISYAVFCLKKKNRRNEWATDVARRIGNFFSDGFGRCDSARPGSDAEILKKLDLAVSDGEVEHRYVQRCRH